MERAIIEYDAARHEASAARALGRAFRDDPSILYILGEESEPKAIWCLLQGIRQADVHGEGFLAVEGEEVLGGAFWVPPGVSPIGGTLEQLRLGGWEAPLRMGVGGLLRELRRQDALARRLREALARPAWYLDLLGVDPSAQGRGVGRSLLAPMLARIDRERADAVLLTYKRTNVELYRRFGFDVEVEEAIPGLPTSWTMRRRPRPDAP